MTYNEAIDYIEGLAVFGSQPGFERIDALLDAIGHPEKALKYVHVAGTNGKGSVCNTTANVLSAAGYKTGLFTSPFVSDFRERIQVDGEYIPKEDLCRLTEYVKSVVDELAAKGIQPTEFEVITAIAFLYFKEVQCDVVVLEVGLGGLLDSTNVIDTPLVSAIVSLSFDHMGVLGNSIEEITAQKAGIIKDGGVTISAPHQPESALHILRAAAYEHENKFIVADPSVVTVLGASILGTRLSYAGVEMTLPLIGPHQIDNLSVSLCIIEVLREKGYNISDEALAAGVGKTTVPARIEVVSQKPLTIIDGGHNEDGARVLGETLSSFTADKEKTMVIGVMEDKDVDHVLQSLAPLAKRIITTTPNSPRSMKAEALAVQASAFCNDVRHADNPCDAYDIAKSLVTGDECLVVCGSLYLAGDVRQHILDSLK